MVDPRPSAQQRAENERRWRGIPRYFAILITILGFIVVGNEIFELVTAGGKLHTGPMLWGTALLSLGMLIIQKGDVKASLDDVVSSGTVVREWFRRGRAADPPGTVVQGKVVVPESEGKKKDTTSDLSGP